MAPQLSQSDADYGSIAELDAAQKSARFSKVAMAVAIVGILFAGVGLIALTRSLNGVTGKVIEDTNIVTEVNEEVIYEEEQGEWAGEDAGWSSATFYEDGLG